MNITNENLTKIRLQIQGHVVNAVTIDSKNKPRFLAPEMNCTVIFE